MSDKKTLEDALKDMEAKNASAAESKANPSPALMAEAAKRADIAKRLAALPQKQRRQVLDAAGLKNISAAPEPITPVRGAGSSYTQSRPIAAPLAIDWSFWKAMRIVKLWQACALVVELDPDTLKQHPQAGMVGPGKGPVFDNRCFPNPDVHARFNRALRLAASAVSYMEGPIFPKGQPHPGSNNEKDVLLSDVVAFFKSSEWPDISVQLLSLDTSVIQNGSNRTESQNADVASTNATNIKESAKTGPLPLTTSDIAFCFDGLRWSEKQWKKPLGDKPKWLQGAIAIPGARGVSETRWNPVHLGAALINSGSAKPKSVRAKFQIQPLLKPWLDEWKTYEADNFDND